MGISGVRTLLERRYGKATGGVASDACEQMDVLVVEVNPILYHAAETVSGSDAAAADLLCERVLARLDTLVAQCSGQAAAGDPCTPPYIALVVDGPAPVAKLPVQRQRRAHYAKQQGFEKAAFTPGTKFMSRLSDTLLGWGKGVVAGNPATSVFLSGAGVPGEGENKDAFVSPVSGQHHGHTPQGVRWLWDLHHAGLLHASHKVCVATSDADLALALLAIPVLHDVVVVDPNLGRGTNLGTLGRLLHQETHTVGYRDYDATVLDFACLQMLRGSDCVPPLDGYDADASWEARLRKVDGPVFAWVDTHGSRDVALHPARLRAALRKRATKASASGRGGSRKAKPSGGSAKRYINTVLWSITTLLTGDCPDYQHVYGGHAVDVDTLVAYLKALDKECGGEVALRYGGVESDAPEYVLPSDACVESGSAPVPPASIEVPEKRGKKKKKKKGKAGRVADEASQAVSAEVETAAADNALPGTPRGDGTEGEDDIAPAAHTGSTPEEDVSIDDTLGVACRSVKVRPLRSTTRLPPPPTLFLTCVAPPSLYGRYLSAKVGAALFRDPFAKEVLEDVDAAPLDVVDAARECLRFAQVGQGRLGACCVLTHVGSDVRGDAGRMPTPPAVVRYHPLLGVGTTWERCLPQAAGGSDVRGEAGADAFSPSACDATTAAPPLCVAIAAAVVAVGVSVCSIAWVADARA